MTNYEYTYNKACMAEFKARQFADPLLKKFWQGAADCYMARISSMTLESAAEEYHLERIRKA